MRPRGWNNVLVPALLLFGLVSYVSAAPAGKIEVCHFPPGNLDNFHTITISENAFAAHLAHGDIGGACNAQCATICDDGNACTIDDTADCETAGCPVISTPVDCNDQNGCTVDSCDSASGCVNTANVGLACDDGAVCSGPDTCNAEGACEGAAIDNCCLGAEDCSDDRCEQASCDLGTNRCDSDPVVCPPSGPCTANECASDTGECVSAPVADGTACPAPEGATGAYACSGGQCQAGDPCTEERKALCIRYGYLPCLPGSRSCVPTNRCTEERFMFCVDDGYDGCEPPSSVCI